MSYVVSYMNPAKNKTACISPHRTHRSAAEKHGQNKIRPQSSDLRRTRRYSLQILFQNIVTPSYIVKRITHITHKPSVDSYNLYLSYIYDNQMNAIDLTAMFHKFQY